MRTPMKARLRVPFLSLLALLGVTLMSACSGGITSPTAQPTAQRASIQAPTGRSNFTGYVVAERARPDTLIDGGTTLIHTLPDSVGKLVGQ